MTEFILSEEAPIAQSVLSDILREMGFPAAVDVEETPDQIILTVTSEQPLGLLIGKGGQTLNAMELIVKQITQHRMKGHGKHLMIDAEGYRERHAERLRELARDVADRVVESGEAISMEPMNARDRRTVHMVVSEIDGIATYSAGEDPYRYVVVCLPGQEPEGATQ